MSNVGGNMSKTTIRVDDTGKKTFVKIKKANGFDIRTLTFQTQLQQIIRGKFNINKFKGLQIKNNSNDMEYVVDFEYVEPIEWEPNHENMKILGISMAHIHNFCYRNANFINLNVKDETYRNTDRWYIAVNKKYENLYVEFRNKRLEYLKTLPPIAEDQIKIALHRDFKPHNILWDGENYHLIDFDFAAVDYITLEIMAFIVDILDSDFDNVNTFLTAYFTYSEVPFKKEMMVTDYLNYLCTNTFPFYMSNTLDEESFLNLVQHRDKAFNSLVSNKEKIEKILCVQ